MKEHFDVENIAFIMVFYEWKRIEFYQKLNEHEFNDYDIFF